MSYMYITICLGDNKEGKVRKAAYKKVAKEADLGLSTWARQVLDNAISMANPVPEPPVEPPVEPPMETPAIPVAEPEPNFDAP